jgi:hypothetical protein
MLNLTSPMPDLKPDPGTPVIFETASYFAAKLHRLTPNVTVNLLVICPAFAF